MPIFEFPAGLTEIAHFKVPCVQTWGNSQKDAEFKKQVRQASSIHPEDAERFAWFVFCIRCVIGESRRREHQTPDVDNIVKLIVDAFTGVLYTDDNLHHVRGVQVEAEWGPDEQQRTMVWIYGQPKEKR